MALVLGTLALVRNGRGAALAATVFAIVGFLVGLSFTVRGGDAIDVAYHATMLPLLLLTLFVLSRKRPNERRRDARHHPETAGRVRPGGAS